VDAVRGDAARRNVPETTTGTRAAICGVHCFFAIFGPAIRPFDLLGSHYKLLVVLADVRTTDTAGRR